MKKIFVVLFLFTLTFFSCEKAPYPYTEWYNHRNENVVVVCNHTDFMVAPGALVQQNELNTSRPLYGWDYQVYLQYDYLREHPIQEGITGTYNLIDY